jgi:hypothetical protein
MAGRQQNCTVERAGTCRAEVREYPNARGFCQVLDGVSDVTISGGEFRAWVGAARTHHDPNPRAGDDRAPLVGVGQGLARSVEADPVAGLGDCGGLGQHDEVIALDAHHGRDLQTGR